MDQALVAWEAFYVCAYTLGMRQSELLGLDWDEVDLEAGTLRISRVLERGKGIRFGRPKSERVRRTLSLPGVTLDALKSHRVSQLEERLAAGGEWPDTGLVFTTPIAVLPWTIETSPRRSSTTWRASDCRNRGSTMPGTLAQRSSCPKECRSLRTIAMPNAVAACLREHRSRQLEERLQAGPLWEGDQWGKLVFCTPTGTSQSRSTVTRRLRKVLREASLHEMTYQHLRHGAASLMAAQGVPARICMEVLEHSQISTTMEIYAHVAPALQREAADKMDAVFA